MGLNLDYINGQTPLEEDEKEGLRIPTISTRTELDEFEQLNIEEAIQWTITHPLTAKTIFSEKFVKSLHYRMFGNIWIWAGKFRKTNKNLGIDKWQIPSALKMLIDDWTFLMENEIYSPEEIAIRFKHRIVSIHCFSNGNGRHSRLMADINVNKVYKYEIFSWGSKNLVHGGDPRSAYHQAIKEADKGNYLPLLAFAKS